MAYDSARGRSVMFGGNNGSSAVLWEWDFAASHQPAAMFIAASNIGTQTLLGLRVRAHCGGKFSPFGSSNNGATLYGWAVGGSGLPAGSWQPLAANTTGLNASQPYLPAPNAALLDWTASSPAEAQRYLRTRDNQLAFQCRPTGSSGANAQEAQVALDYIDVAVRYAAP